VRAVFSRRVVMLFWSAEVDHVLCAGVSSKQYETMQGYTSTGLKIVRDGWGKSAH